MDENRFTQFAAALSDRDSDLWARGRTLYRKRIGALGCDESGADFLGFLFETRDPRNDILDGDGSEPAHVTLVGHRYHPGDHGRHPLNIRVPVGDLFGNHSAAVAGLDAQIESLRNRMDETRRIEMKYRRNLYEELRREFGSEASHAADQGG